MFQKAKYFDCLHACSLKQSLCHVKYALDGVSWELVKNGNEKVSMFHVIHVKHIHKVLTTAKNGKGNCLHVPATRFIG